MTSLHKKSSRVSFDDEPGHMGLKGKEGYYTAAASLTDTQAELLEAEERARERADYLNSDPDFVPFAGKNGRMVLDEFLDEFNSDIHLDGKYGRTGKHTKRASALEKMTQRQLNSITEVLSKGKPGTPGPKKGPYNGVRHSHVVTKQDALLIEGLRDHVGRQTTKLLSIDDREFIIWYKMVFCRARAQKREVVMRARREGKVETPLHTALAAVSRNVVVHAILLAPTLREDYGAITPDTYKRLQALGERAIMYEDFLEAWRVGGVRHGGVRVDNTRPAPSVRRFSEMVDQNQVKRVSPGKYDLSALILGGAKKNAQNKQASQFTKALKKVASAISTSRKSPGARKASRNMKIGRRERKAFRSIHGPHISFPSVHHHLLREGVKMQPQTVDYLASITHDSFNPSSMNLKLPWGSGSTQSVSRLITFDVTCSATGTGYIAFTPSLDSLKDSAQYTTSTYAGAASIIRTSVFTTGTAGAKVTWPYTWVQLTDTSGVGNSEKLMQYRLVSAAAKIRYTGTRLAAAGVAYVLRAPHCSDLTGKSGTDLMNEYPTTKKYYLNSVEEFNVNWFPVNPQQKDLIDAAASNLPFPVNYPSVMNNTTAYWDTSTGSATAGGTSFAVIFSGCESGATFTVKMVVTAEFSGKNVGNLATPIIHDAALDAAHSIAHTAEHLHAAEVDTPHEKHVNDAIESIAGKMAPELLTGAATMVGGPEAGAMVGGVINELETHKRQFKNTMNDINKIGGTLNRLFLK